MTLLQLSDEERDGLQRLLADGPFAKEHCRIQALLWLAAGQLVERITDILGVSRRTVYYWVQRFHERPDLDLRARLADAPRPGRPPTALGIIDPLIAAVIDRDPRELGYRSTGWTNRLLRRYLQEVHHLSISRKSVSRALARLRIRWKRPRHQLARRPDTWRQSKGGLKNGLKGRVRTVLLMLDETIVTETPPLYAAYGHIGEQVRVPITGNRAKRILHGAINVGSGDVALLITDEWDQETHQAFLSLVRSHWRGWHIVLFEDRAGQHTAPASRAYAARLGIEVRLLPKATPELNAMDHLWRHTKRETQGNRPPQPIEESAMDACRYILDMSPRERLCQAGVLSGNFWLTT